MRKSQTIASIALVSIIVALGLFSGNDREIGVKLASADAPAARKATPKLPKPPKPPQAPGGQQVVEEDEIGAAAVFAQPTYSSSIAITPNNQFVWVVNPDNNSVSAHLVAGDANRLIREIRVGREPWSVALTANNKAYVCNMLDGTVSVINTRTFRVTKTLVVGSDPVNCALTPDGRKLYVANFSSDSVSVIDTRLDRVIRTINGVGPKPRGIAITTNGKVYVTCFLAVPRNDGRTQAQKEGRDDGHEGRVFVLSSRTDRVLRSVVLNPIPDTGFKSNGSVLDRIAAVNPPAFDFTTGAFPNLLHGICVKGNRVYIVNTASSPNGPVRFNVNVQGVVSVINADSDQDTGQTLNMNRGVGFEPVGVRLFNTNPLGIAFKSNSNEGYGVLAATNRLIRIELGADGQPTINAPTAAGQPSGIVRIPVGTNPQGIVLNSSNTRAYVMNFLSRDVSVVDIADGSPNKHREIARIRSASLPPAGTLAAVILRGHELFNTSVGPTGTNENAIAPAGRMSDFGWGACYSCHPRGLTDGVTWMFGDGPRQSISMESTAEHPQPANFLINANGAPVPPLFKIRPLNWSAVRDEVQDFELNTRNVSGGQGLITDGQAVVNLTPTATTGRSVDQDAIAAYVAFGIRAPVSPHRNVSSTSPLGRRIAQGRRLFAQANCQSCHGGPNWTRARLDFTPPPGPGETITDGQLVKFLKNVGTFNPANANQLRPNLAVANGALGFNIPSLLSVFAGSPYFHDGSAVTLGEVMNNVTHRSAGTGGVDTLSNSNDRALLVDFLNSIDARTPTFP